MVGRGGTEHCADADAASLAALLEPGSEHLPPDLFAHVKQVREAAAIAETAQVLRVCRTVSLARAATGRRANGESALHECARLLGMSRQAMQEYATVGARWADDELPALVGLRDRNGALIGIARLVLLARVCAPERSELLARVLSEALDVRSIRALCRERR